MRFIYTIALCSLATSLNAQQAAPQKPRPHAAASTRATTTVQLDGRWVGGAWFPNALPLAEPAKISIDYGQPHLRGRTLEGSKLLSSPSDTIWRMGANVATHLQTDVDIELGGVKISKGFYTLYLRTGDSPSLIVNRETGQWGTVYSSANDVARIPLTVHTLAQPMDAFTIWLVPVGAGAEGNFRMAWGKSEWTTTWKVVVP